MCFKVTGNILDPSEWLAHWGWCGQCYWCIWFGLQCGFGIELSYLILRIGGQGLSLEFFDARDRKGLRVTLGNRNSWDGNEEPTQRSRIQDRCLKSHHWTSLKRWGFLKHKEAAADAVWPQKMTNVQYSGIDIHSFTQSIYWGLTISQFSVLGK